MQVHQLIPGMSVGDAVTNHALEIQRGLKNMGYESDIFSVPKHVSLHMKEACRDYRLYSGTQNDLMLYHFSTGSELTPFFKNLSAKKMLVYHNITPAHFFRWLSQEKAESVEEGRQQLKELAEVPALACGVSEYNRQELEAAGFKKTEVLPLIIDPTQWNGHVNPALLKKFKDGRVNFLFVGRIAPNKKFEDLIRTFYFYQKTINPHSRLLLVGSYIGMEKYYAYLKALVNELDLKEVHFSGHVSDEDVRTYYKCADLFLCMSEHEGFCLPLLEAIHSDLPVLAYASSAIPETLAGTGILIREKNYLEIAEMVDKILADNRLKSDLVQAQKERLKPFSRDAVMAQLKQYVETF